MSTIPSKIYPIDKSREITMSRSVLDASVKDAARPLFELIDLPYDEGIVMEFLSTTDGKKLLASAARMLSFINEKNITVLEKAAGLWGSK